MYSALHRKTGLNAVSLLLVLLLVAAEGEFRLVLVVVVNEKVLALVRIREGAGRGGGLQLVVLVLLTAGGGGGQLFRGQGLGPFRHGGGQAARGLVPRILHKYNCNKKATDPDPLQIPS